MSDDKKSKFVKLDDAGLFVGPAVEMDYTADAFTYPPPPPAGLYDIKLMPAKEAITFNRLDVSKGWDDPDNVYYRYNFACPIVSEGEAKGTLVFPSVTTLTGRRNISSIVGLVKLVTGKTPKKANLTMIEQVKMMEMVVKAEPVLHNVWLDWEAYSKADETTVCRTMADFPKDGKGGYMSTFIYTTKNRSREEVNAQLRVKAWDGKTKYEAATKGAASNGAADASLALEGFTSVAAPTAAPLAADALDSLL
jgi:hypothetical protein